jgi:hypothetical protein
MICFKYRQLRTSKLVILSRKPNNLPFHTFTAANMPLVVPGINSNDAGSKTEEWMNKLAGKKIGETSDATVCSCPLIKGQRRLICA